MSALLSFFSAALAAYFWYASRAGDRRRGLELAVTWLVLAIVPLWSLQAWAMMAPGILLVGAIGLFPRGNAVKGLHVALGSDHYRDRERGILAAAEMATPEAWRVLLAHLADVNAGENEEELLAIFRALLKGWGGEHVVSEWPQLPAQARMDFLEFSQGSAQFQSSDVLALSRRGMDDEHEAIARRAWRTYAYTVTTGAESGRADFDLGAWLEATTDDANVDVQGLRARLEEKRLAEAQTQELDALVARYRAEVFKQMRTVSVQLAASEPQRFAATGGRTLELTAGTHPAQLSGTFDSAQDAVDGGWHFVVQLADASGTLWSIDATWDAEEFFTELLAARHDPQRHWFDEAPPELVAAFSLQPLVGPAATYGDGWEGLTFHVDDQEFSPVGTQILSCLIARAPGASDAPTRLAFLIYELEDANADGDELRPFVTVVDLERWLLSGVRDGLVESARVELLKQPDGDPV